MDFGTRVTRVLVRKAKGLDRIQIDTAAGISGYGEGGWSDEALLRSPELVIGRSVFETEAIFDDLSSAGAAPAGLDMALWDASARITGRQACELLGKVYRRHVRILPALSEDGIVFREEPLAAEDLEGYRRLKRTCTEPVAAGRTMSPDVLLRDFIQNELIDLALADIGRAGLTGLRRLAYYCWLFRVRLGVACPGSSLTIAAALHAAACFVPVTRAMAAPEPFLLLPSAATESMPVPDGLGLGVEPEWRRLPPDVILEGKS
jgi:L-alanine-DL-glutamate epimerase-like enolase superfamily enzyme